MPILNIQNLLHSELTSKINDERFSLSAVLTDYLKFKDLFVHHEILPSGRRSSSPHSHSAREEMIFVLAGHPTVHIGEESSRLKPGDFVGFKPSEKLHFLENQSENEVQVLVISSNSINDQVNYDKIK